MGVTLPEDEIRSTIHLKRELLAKFEEACQRKYGKGWKKKDGYRDAMEKFVTDTLGEDIVDTESTPDTPTVSTEITTSKELSTEEKEKIAMKLADERKRQQQLLNPPPVISPTSIPKSSDDITSFLNNLPKDRKVRVTRIEIE